jgi:hypothetical protein
MDLSMDVDIHGFYPPNTSTWMWSVLSMDIQLDIHPLPSLNLAVVEIEYKVPSTHYGISPDIATVGL